MSVLDFIRPEFQSMDPYRPSDHGTIRLHANELPWSPLEELDIKLNHYPDWQQQLALEQQLAKHYQVASDNLLLTRGSDDGLDLLMRLVLSEGKHSVLLCPPTFPMYAFYAQLQNAGILQCPLLEDNGFELSTERLIAAWQPGCKIVILCRPNNPTGSVPTLAQIADLCQHFGNKSLVLVDEAYIEFADAPSASELLSDYPNLVVLRTLSKAYGLAGLRLGVVMASSPLIRALKSIMPPYTLPSPVISLAQKALQNQAWFVNAVQTIKEAREQLQEALRQFPCIDKVFPSQGNFLLVKSKEAQAIADSLAEQGLNVRRFKDEALKSLLRISIGSEGENATLLRFLSVYSGE